MGGGGDSEGEERGRGVGGWKGGWSGGGEEGGREKGGRDKGWRHNTQILWSMALARGVKVDMEFSGIME